ncbi:MAG: hypothetical protein PUF16_05080 [Lachnospiraceae bacterium]|nr:hypothetical protein [Lachnospiraceae bacterium]
MIRKILEFLEKKYGAYYTLEAAWMFGLTLVVFFSIIFLSFNLYHETVSEIKRIQPVQINAVKEFREINAVRDIAEAVTERN